MRILAVVILGLALLASSALAATLPITGTTPTQYVDNLGLCVGTLVAYPIGTTFTVHVKWWQSGADSIGAPEDSLTAVGLGVPFAFFKQVPAGVYRKRAWVTLGAEIGCDTTLTRFVGGKPWRPTIAP